MDGYECGGFNFSLEEVEDGFKVYIRGDKDALRPKLEAIQAYLNYQEKAKAAGWHTGHKHWPGFMYGHHSMHGHGQEKIKRFMGHFQKAFKEAMGEVKDEK